MSRFKFSLAAPGDDAQLRERMASDWIEGAAAISLRREPSYFAVCRLQGKQVQVITGREASSGRIVAMGSRCITTTFIDGRPERTAYLADLFIDPAYRNGTLLSRTYRFLRELHETDPLPCHTLIYNDNETALRHLTGGRAGLPLYRPCGRLLASSLHLTKRLPALTMPGVELQRADAGDLPEVIDFLNQCRLKHRWAPVLSLDDFRPDGRCGTLQPQDFFIARRHGRICATMAAWDQSDLRQTHVERYARPTAWLRHGYNLFARLRGMPRLPAPGQALPYVYLACIAAEDDDPALCRTLLRHVYNALCGGRWLYALAALHEDEPLSAVFADYRAAASAIRLYEVDFDATHGDAARPPSGASPRIEFALI